MVSADDLFWGWHDAGPLASGRSCDGNEWHGLYSWDDEEPPDYEPPFEPPYDHPAADPVDGTGDEPERSDAEVPHDVPR